MAYRKSSRSIDQTGRSKLPPSYVKLDRWFLHHEAFRALSPVARCLILELLDRCRGDNNGRIVLSTREAQQRLGVAKETITWGFRELVALGFVEVARQSAFSLKTKLAREFALTWLPIGAALPTKEFASLTGARLVAAKQAFAEERARVCAARKARTGNQSETDRRLALKAKHAPNH